MSHPTTNYNVVIYIKLKLLNVQYSLIINYRFPIQIEHPFRKLKNRLYIAVRAAQG